MTTRSGLANDDGADHEKDDPMTQMTQMTQGTGPRVLGPEAGEIWGEPSFRQDRFLIDGKDSGGGLALVEHTLAPHVLAAPLHLHTREDEFSFVLEGRLAALLGDDEIIAGPGDLVFNDGALAELFEAGAVLVIDGDAHEAHGGVEISRLAAALWQSDRTYVARPARTLQAEDTALVLAKGGINVERRGEDGVWRYAIALLQLHATSSS